MTIQLWRDILGQYAREGTRTEQLMASMLISLSKIDDPLIVRMFDAYASDILEMQP